MRFARKYRYFVATIAFSVILLIIVVSLFSIDNSTNQMIVEYIEGLGWEINHTPSEISHLTLPKEFDVVYETYNSVQINSGFDMSPYKGKGVSRYSYKVLNHIKSEETEVIASVFVYENQIIAGDICSTAINGFMHAINETSNMK